MELFKNDDFKFRFEFRIFVQFLVDILPLGSVSVDPPIFAGPNPESQNLADPTDPDPKHCFLEYYLIFEPLFLTF